MEKRTGEISLLQNDLEIMEMMMDLKSSEMVPLSEKQERVIKPMTYNNRKGYMRNQPCACGSGKKYKKCCW